MTSFCGGQKNTKKGTSITKRGGRPPFCTTRGDGKRTYRLVYRRSPLWYIFEGGGVSGSKKETCFKNFRIPGGSGRTTSTTGTAIKLVQLQVLVVQELAVVLLLLVLLLLLLLRRLLLLLLLLLLQVTNTKTISYDAYWRHSNESKTINIYIYYTYVVKNLSSNGPPNSKV